MWLSRGTWVVLAVLVAGTVLAPLQGRLSAYLGAAELEVTLTAGQPGTVELFVDSGRGFNGEQVSRVAFLPGGPQVIRLPIPCGCYVRMRLDPTSTVDAVSIDRTAIVGPGDRRLDLEAAAWQPIHDVAACRIDGTGLFVTTSGADPQLVMTPRSPIQVGGGARTAAAALLAVTGLVVVASLLAGSRLLAAATDRLPASARAGAWIACGAVVLIASRAAWLDAPLLDRNAFRQTQTAITASWFVSEGVSLPGYPLPVLGRPWQAPMEFPTYQLVAAAAHRLGVPLDMACRGVGLASFVACCTLLARLLLRQGCPPGAVALLAVFAFASPFALVWSKAALIEFTAVLLGLAYVGIACDVHERGAAVGRVILLVACGCATAATKITTFAVFVPAVALLAAHHLWVLRARGGGVGRWLPAGAVWVAALAAPVAVGQWWIEVADAIKESSEATSWLTSARLREWNFGSFAQRCDLRNWLTIGSRIRLEILPFLWLFALAGAVELCRLPVRLALAGLGMLAGSVAAVAVFFNLYVVHDYYLCAAAFPLWVAAAVGIDGLAGRCGAAAATIRRLVVPTVLAILVAVSGLSDMVAESYVDQADHEVVQFGRLVRQVVPAGEEVVVFGRGSLNADLAYYSQRKAFNTGSAGTSDDFVMDYVARNGVTYLLAAGGGENRLLDLFPNAVVQVRAGPFTVYRRPP